MVVNFISARKMQASPPSSLAIVFINDTLIGLKKMGIHLIQCKNYVRIILIVPPFPSFSFLFSNIFLLKFVTITKNTHLLSILDIFCTPKQCTCVLFGIEKQPFYTRMIPNFKYKWPLWAICTPPLSNDVIQRKPKSSTSILQGCMQA